MSFDISGNLVLVALLVPVGLVFAIATMPRWLIRSVSKHSLWRLRDEVVDDSLSGMLPADHPAVRELVARLEWAISESRSFDLLHLMVWNRAKREVHPKVLESRARVPDLTSLPSDQEERIRAYRGCYDSVAIRALLLSSWIGIGIVFWTAIPVAFKVLLGTGGTEYAHQRSLPGGLRVVVRVATEEVAEDTKLGQRAREFVNEKGPALELVPALA
jgi:hypothetical protein